MSNKRDRQIFYDKNTGDVIFDSGEGEGFFIDQTLDDYIRDFPETFGSIIKENIGEKKVCKGTDSDKFAKHPYKIDKTTGEVVFDLTKEKQEIIAESVAAG